MLRYVLCRFLLLIPVMLTASVIISLILRFDTGDLTLDYLRLSDLLSVPEMLASTRTMLGLDQPLCVQCGIWLWKALCLDFGISFASQHPVLDNALNSLSAMLGLTGAALTLILPTSVPLGIWAACYRDRLPDFAVRFTAFLGVSMPNFWLVFSLVMVFSVYLQWLPAMGYGGWQHIILSAVSIASTSLAIDACLLRASILDVIDQHHVTQARLRGLNDKQTERRHILRNASLPMITVVGMHVDELIGGAVTIENIFTWPDVGHYAASAIFNRDYLVVQCPTLMTVVVLVVCNLIVGLLNAALDPRIRRREEAHA